MQSCCKSIDRQYMNENKVDKRDKKLIANKDICFDVRATALRPRLHHREGFPID